MNTFLITLQPLLIMFTCMGIGVVLNKAKITPENTDTVLSKLLTRVLLPALIIKTFTRYCNIDSLATHGASLLYCVLGIALTTAIAFPLSKLFQREGYERKLYLYGFLSANFGFLGNALVPYILGDEGLYRYMLFAIPMQMMCYGVFVNILTPEGEKKTKGFNNPVFPSLLIGIVLGLTGAERYMPSFVLSTVDNLAACMGPMSMVLAGFVVGRYPFRQLLQGKKVYFATLIRLIVLPAVVMLLLHLCGAGKDVLIMALFAFGTPLGMNVVVFPTSYGISTHTGAAMVMVSHVACVLTIPMIYAILMML